MKKSYLVFLVSGLVMLSVIIWLISSGTSVKMVDIWQGLVIILVVGFALFIGVKRLKSERRGEPAEDELSKKVLQKTAAWSYYVSLYLWVAVLFIKDRVELDSEELIGTGIIGMALSFAVCWLIINFTGIRNE